MFGAIYPQSEEVIVFWWPDGAINGCFRGLVVGKYGQSYRGASFHQLAYQGEPLCGPEIWIGHPPNTRRSLLELAFQYEAEAPCSWLSQTRH
jgi:hypothetical protein